MEHLLDAFTNLVSLVPDTPAGLVIEGVTEVVKQIAVGAFGGLPGLAVMDPASNRLSALNRAVAAADTTIHAVTSDFAPNPAGFQARAVDKLADLLFDSAPNDLVVPTESVYRTGGYLVDDRYVVPPPSAVSHSAYFNDPAVRERLLHWLPGATQHAV